MATEINLKFKGLKVKHLEAISKIKDDMTIKDRAELISAVLGVDRAILYRIDNISFNSLYDVVINDLKRVSEAELVKQFELDGQRYKFIEEAKQPIGWVIDAENIEKTPENIMALYYLEKECTNYSEVNDDMTQKYNTYQRAEKLKEADLAIYVGLSKYLKKKFNLWLDIMEKMMQIEAKLRNQMLITT